MFSSPWQELPDLGLLPSAGWRPGYQGLDRWCSVPAPTCSGRGCGRAMCQGAHWGRGAVPLLRVQGSPPSLHGPGEPCLPVGWCQERSLGTSQVIAQDSAESGLWALGFLIGRLAGWGLRGVLRLRPGSQSGPCPRSRVTCRYRAHLPTSCRFCEGQTR